MVNDNGCPRCFGSRTSNQPFGVYPIVYFCAEHGLNSSWGSTPSCGCLEALSTDICPTCLGTNSAAVGMIRKIQGKL